MKFLQVIFKKFIIYSIFLLSVAFGYAQFVIPPKPNTQNSKAIYDKAKILTQHEYQSLNNKLLRYSDTTGTQIVFASIESLKGEDIGILSSKWAHQWGIGQKKDDNGVFILLAKNDRKIWISPGYGTEIYLTASRIGDITRNYILPSFKKGHYYQGLEKGTNEIIKVLSGKFTAPTQQGGDWSMTIVFFVIVIIMILIVSRRSKQHYDDGTPSIDDIITISSMGSLNLGSERTSNHATENISNNTFNQGFDGGGFSGGGAGGSW